MTLYRTLDPTTGELLETFKTASEPEIADALSAARGAFAPWRRRPLAERVAVLEQAAEVLEESIDELALMMAIEMGKPLAQGRGEVSKCAWVCRYYVQHAGEMLAPRTAESDGSEAWIRHEPLGPILAIMPWNFPLWQVFRFAAPALAAGNVALLKHAPNTPRCAVAIERIWHQAGAPNHVFQNLFLSNEQAARVIQAPEVRGVTLTGSTRAGREVAAIAGRALRPMVMELGGSDPFLVFADADIDRAVQQAVGSRCLNSGQSCIAAKRFLVEASVYDDFLARFVDAMKSQTVGDPKHDTTQIGPLAREDLRDLLDTQVEQAKQAGARVAYGGKRPEGPGFFYAPTVLVDLPPASEAARQELFGPVAVVYRFDDEHQALDLANATDYGLGASLWTADRQRAERLIPEIDAGSVFVNGFVKSDPRLPFGGTKQSGFGRELAREGMLEFVNLKTVWIA